MFDTIYRLRVVPYFGIYLWLYFEVLSVLGGDIDSVDEVLWCAALASQLLVNVEKIPNSTSLHEVGHRSISS